VRACVCVRVRARVCLCVCVIVCVCVSPSCVLAFLRLVSHLRVFSYRHKWREISKRCLRLMTGASRMIEKSKKGKNDAGYRQNPRKCKSTRTRTRAIEKSKGDFMEMRERCQSPLTIIPDFNHHFQVFLFGVPISRGPSQKQMDDCEWL